MRTAIGLILLAAYFSISDWRYAFVLVICLLSKSRIKVLIPIEVPLVLLK